MEEKTESPKRKIKFDVWKCLISALLVVCLIQNINLKTQIQNLQSNMGMRISEVQSGVNSMSGIVSNTLQQEASQLSLAEYELQDLDIDSKTVELVCKILPKEYTEESTTVSAVYKGKEYEFPYQGEIFEGSIPISLFEDAHIESVIMRDGSTVRTEKLDWYLSPRYDYLPIVYANFSSTYSSRTENRHYIWDLSGQIDYSFDAKDQQVEEEKIDFYACLDGKEIERMDITKDPHVPIAKVYEIPFGSTLCLYAEVTDSYGLHHRALIECMNIDEEGQRIYDDNEWMWRGAAAEIYDENGDLLYSEYEIKE